MGGRQGKQSTHPSTGFCNVFLQESVDEAGAGGTEESFLDSEVSIEVRPRCFPDDLQDEIEVLGAEGVDMPGGGDTDVAQDEEVHEDGEIVNGEVSGSHCVISF